MKLTTRQAKTKAQRTIPETDAIVLRGRERRKEGRKKEEGEKGKQRQKR